MNKIEIPEDYSGFIIVILSSKIIPSSNANSLIELAQTRKLNVLVELLKKFEHVKSNPYINNLQIDEIIKIEEKAASNGFPPLESLTSYWHLDCRVLSEEEAEKLVKLLNRLPEVNLAYRERSMGYGTSVNAGDDPFSQLQGYLDPAPVGIDAKWAWTQPNGDGTAVGLVHVEEGWLIKHQDLLGNSPEIIFGDNHDNDADARNHGTMVLGVVAAVDNTVGIVGVAPNCAPVRLASIFNRSTNTSNSLGSAIYHAIGVMQEGDVLLLTMGPASGGNQALPAETERGVFNAIRSAVGNGIIVVESAGNVSTNIDGAMLKDKNGEGSNAIIVGASTSEVGPSGRGHARASFSNFGTRVDCYAWGEHVTTCGFVDVGSDLTPETDDLLQKYTSGFIGTSSSTPIIAGAAIILQGYCRTKIGRYLSPIEMRSLFMCRTIGNTPQESVPIGNIGVMPNLKAIIENCFKPWWAPRTLDLSVYATTLEERERVSGFVTTSAPLCHTPKLYAFTIYDTPQKVTCIASSVSCLGQPVYLWQINDVIIDDIIKSVGHFEVQTLVREYDMTDPTQEIRKIIPVDIECELSDDGSTLTLTFAPTFKWRLYLEIIVSAPEVVGVKKTTIGVANEKVIYDGMSKDSKACADEMIHYLDHRIQADPRLELLKNYVEPSSDFVHVFSELHEIMAILRELSVIKPDVAQELKTAITKMLNISSKTLDTI